jgi:pyruvate-ferredoxin/flavodoxin oxidoreductase
LVPTDVLKTKSFRSREVPGLNLTVQVAPDDCTGCGLCVVACPAHDKTAVKRKSINLRPIGEHLDTERVAWDEFLALESADATRFDPASVKTSQLRTPLFEFSGACSGCGETPYLKLLTQLFGDRLLIANATGCSSIYGGNLPTTPVHHGRRRPGPGLGQQPVRGQRRVRSRHPPRLRGAAACRTRDARSPRRPARSRARRVDPRGSTTSATPASPPSALVSISSSGPSPASTRPTPPAGGDRRGAGRPSVWIVGGDGWAYDIGAGGLDHVLGSGRNVNILVMDTEVYSNTGGQASKATPRAAVAKFAASGKGIAKKDLGLEAMTFGDVYVAQIAMGASDVQTVKALLEADAWPGVSLVIAYSTCIAHGFDMNASMTQQKLAVQSGHWPLYRYRPGGGEATHPFQLDSAEPSVPYDEFARSEARFAMLTRSDPARAAELLRLAQADVAGRWNYYQQLAGLERSAPEHAGGATLAEQEDES